MGCVRYALSGSTPGHPASKGVTEEQMQKIVKSSLYCNFACRAGTVCILTAVQYICILPACGIFDIIVQDELFGCWCWCIR